MNSNSPTKKNSTKKQAQDLRHLTKEDIQMPNEHLERCSTSHIKKTPIKAARYHHTPIRMTKMQNTDDNIKG